MPGHVELGGEAGGAAHHLFAAPVRADAGQQGLARRPDGRLRGGDFAAVGLHLAVDPVGGAAQRQFAQGQQVALAEEIACRDLGLLRDVDLALLQALDQFVGRQVDDDHLVGLVEDAVGDGFPDANAGDAADDVVERFKVLDVDRGADVDAGREQFFHVLPAFGVARAGGVAVRQFVDQDELRPACQRAVEVEFAQRVAAVGDFPERQAFQAVGHDLGFGPSVRFDHADDDVLAGEELLARHAEHGVGFSDAGRGTEENLQFAARGARRCGVDPVEKLVGVRARFGFAHAVLFRASRRA